MSQVLTITLLAAPVLLLHVITPLLDIISKEHFKEVKVGVSKMSTSLVTQDLCLMLVSI